MPYMDIAPADITSDDAGFVLAQMKLLAVMAWPSDPVVRDRIIALTAEPSLERRVLELGEPPFADRDFLLKRGERTDPHALMREQIATAVVTAPAKAPHAIELTGGQVCGALLIKALRMQDDGEQNITLGKCKATLSAELKETHSQSCRPEDLAHHWKAYQSVACLYAAEMRLLFRGIRAESKADFCRLLYVADTFRRRAEGILVRNVGPLIEPSVSWTVSPAVIHTIMGAYIGKQFPATV